jgi:hypothetical protein
MYVYVVGCVLDVCVDVCTVTRATVDHMDMDMEATMKYRKVVMRGMMWTLSRTLYIDVVSG